MLRRLRNRRSLAERVRLPHPVPWGVLGLGLVALGAVAIAPGVLGVAGPLASTPVRQVVSGSVGDVVGTALAVAGVFALRTAAFARLARRPGPVEITLAGGGETKAGADGAPVDADGVLAEFRAALTGMSLATLQSVPTKPLDDGFLDNVTTIADKPGNWLVTAAGLLSALLDVRHAYRVTVQLRRRSGSAPCGLTVHVLARPGSRGIVDTLWADDWTEVAERAAHRVGAFIVVRSRLSRRGTWSGWHGLEMPADLFHRSQLGRRYLTERRFEEAIAQFHAALELDPLNPYLRILLAQTQEQIGLHLDALAGYADVIAVESWHDRRLWRRLRRLLDDDPTAQSLSPLVARPVHGRDALLVARYRLVARLTSASELSGTWHQSIRDEAGYDRVDNLKRMRERIALRRRVTVWLEAYHQLFMDALGLPRPEPMSFEQFSSDKMRFRHFLHFVGCAEVLHLIDDYRWLGGRRRPGMPVTQTSLRVMRVWAPLHLQLAELDVTEEAWREFGRPQFPRSSWPPDGAELDRRLARVLRRKPAVLREWQEHYNAACAVAVALTPLSDGSAGVDESVRRDLSLRAVRHLERAVSATDSRSVGSYAQWLATGDADLRSLRQTPAFVDFLDRHLPNPAPRASRPDKLVPLVMSLHSLKLVHRYCDARVSVLRTAGSVASAELAREAEVCELVRTFLADDQDWASRLELIREGKAFCRRHGLPAFDGRLPFFQDDPAVTPRPAGTTVGTFPEIVDYRRERRTALAAAVPQKPAAGASRVARLTLWRTLRDVIEASYLPTRTSPR